MKKARMKLHILLAAFFVCALLAVGMFPPAISPLAANADTTAYTTVMEDLKSDENFKTSDYPADYKDYSLQVIQIAESSDKELFVYVYQPSHLYLALVAKEIRFATGTDESARWHDYALTKLSTQGVFAKYRVEDFTVSDKTVRQYNIAALLRDYDKIADGGTNAENTEKAIAVEVGQLWTAVTAGGVVSYVMEQAETVTITGYTFGTLRYSDGYDWWGAYACDSHFIAFSTDWDIDMLLEADVSFVSRYFEQGMYGYEYGEYEKHDNVTVTYKEKAENAANHWWAENRTWDRIQTADQFVDSMEQLENKDESVLRDIRKQQWVLAFYETDYMDNTGGVTGWLSYIGELFGYRPYNGTEISDVSILRLKFLSEGEVYNLGVVSNKSGTSQVVGSDDITLGEKVGTAVETFFEDIWSWIGEQFNKVPWWAWVLIGLGVVLVIAVVVAIIRKKHDGEKNGNGSS